MRGYLGSAARCGKKNLEALCEYECKPGRITRDSFDALVRAGRKREEEWEEKYAPPALLERNMDAWAVYSACRNQKSRHEWFDERSKKRFAIVEIRVEAIASVMDMFGVDDRRECFEKVRHVDRYMTDLERRYSAS